MPTERTTLDAGFAFFHGAVQSIPQGVALESERFLLFPPHHDSNVQYPHLPNQKNEVFLSICNPFIGIGQDFLAPTSAKDFLPLIGNV